MDGVAAAGPLAQRSKVLMLSYSEDEHLVTGAIRNGAAGYLVHGRFEPDELEGRIKAVARGEMVLSPAVTPAVFDVLRRAPGVVQRRGRARPGLADRPRARGPQPARPRQHEPRDRRAAVHHQQDRQEPPLAHLREDRRALPRRGDRPLAGRQRRLGRQGGSGGAGRRRGGGGGGGGGGGCGGGRGVVRRPRAAFDFAVGPGSRGSQDWDPRPPSG